MLAPLTVALLLAPAPLADDFHDRVTRGRLAEAAASGPAYQKRLWAQIGDPMTDALTTCLRTLGQPDKAPFTLVADIAADGRPTRLEVQPRTPLAECLADRFAGWTMPAPPETPAPYPIEIDVSITR